MRQIRKPIASAAAEAAKRALRVPSACRLKPSRSLKSVRPLLPPKPMSLRKNASIRAKVMAWVMIER